MNMDNGMRYILLTALLIFSLSITASAQLVEQAEVKDAQQDYSLGLKPAVTPFSLLDLSRVKWSNSYSVSFFSGGGTSGSQGVWRTSMFYEFSSRLSLSLNVGVAHDISGVWGDENNNARILPGFNLDYHPSDKFRLSIGMQTYSGRYYNPYYPLSSYYDSFWGRSR